MSKKIMIIDDSASIRQVVSLTLKESGYEVMDAIDGQDALNKLTGDKIHLIICDVNMPNLDGIQFVKEVKNNPQYANYKFTPIIMLTTESEEEKKLQGQAAGAKAWIVKPFLPERLLAAVQKLALP
ncbi:MAG: response regulator [Spirochaetia bacterium]|nr:response regulator [Spirochaetia bacterium]